LLSKTNILGTGQAEDGTETLTYKVKNIMPPVQHKLWKHENIKLTVLTNHVFNRAAQINN